MKNKIRYHTEGRYFEITMYGEVSIEQLIELFADCLRHPQHSESIGYLSDYRQATPMFNFDDFQRLVDYAKQFSSSTNRNYLSAAVLADSVDLEFAKIYESFSSQLKNEEFRIFNTIEAARKWIRDEGRL
ncbi:MAG: STAS/SEC14 domain-containing protein [Kangiellaceae bacterium]|nr:STAS/SEC14 domain-containing protein [Kangiellaceae bacterium]